jgi:hypothetical protein
MSRNNADVEVRLATSSFGLRATRISMAAGQLSRGQRPSESGLRAARTMAEDLRREARALSATLERNKVDPVRAPLQFSSPGMASIVRTSRSGPPSDGSLAEELESLAQTLDDLAAHKLEDVRVLRALKTVFTMASAHIVNELSRDGESNARLGSVPVAS